MGKLTKAQLEDMSLDELAKLVGKKGLSKSQMVAKLAPKPKRN